MNNDPLDELAGMVSSARHTLILAVLSVALPCATVAIGVEAGLAMKPVITAAFGSLFAAFALSTLVKTPASAIPAVRLLRERPADVAFIVAINRGSKRVVVLLDRNREQLAKPILLKGTAVRRPGEVAGALRNDAAVADHAVELVRSVCPGAKTATISDHIGISSPAKVAAKAVRAA